MYDLFYGGERNLALVVGIHWGCFSSEWYLTVLYQATGERSTPLKLKEFALARPIEENDERL